MCVAAGVDAASQTLVAGGTTAGFYYLYLGRKISGVWTVIPITTNSIPTGTLAAGTHSYRVKVSDGLGCESAYATATIKVNENRSFPRPLLVIMELYVSL